MSMPRRSLFAVVVFMAGLSAWAADTTGKKEVQAKPEAKVDVTATLESYWSEDEAEAEALSLDVVQCVDMAVAKNAQVLMAQDDIDAARERIGQANAQRLPHVKVDVGFRHLEPVGGSSGGIMSFLSPGTSENTRRDHAALSQVLYAGGQIKAAVKASEFLAQSSEWQRKAVLNNLAFETKKAYYDCLLARAMVRVAQESVLTFERHLSDAQQMLEVGLISNFEVLRAKTELGARQADLTAAQNARRLALVNLRRLLTLGQDLPIKLVGRLELPAEPAAIEELLKEAQSGRPELMALDKAIAGSEQNVLRTKGQYKPQAAAGVEWTNTDNGGSFAQDGWSFTLGGEWTLYAGGQRKHQVGEANAQKRKLEHQKEDVVRLVEMDVRAAHIQLEDALARIEREKGTVELGMEGRRLASLRFQEGVGTQAETLDAELALTNAETMLVRAMHDCAVASIAIDKAVGRGPAAPPEDSPGAK